MQIGTIFHMETLKLGKNTFKLNAIWNNSNSSVETFLTIRLSTRGVSNRHWRVVAKGSTLPLDVFIVNHSSLSTSIADGGRVNRIWAKLPKRSKFIWTTVNNFVPFCIQAGYKRLFVRAKIIRKLKRQAHKIYVAWRVGEGDVFRHTSVTWRIRKE